MNSSIVVVILGANLLILDLSSQRGIEIDDMKGCRLKIVVVIEAGFPSSKNKISPISPFHLITKSPLMSSISPFRALKAFNSRFNSLNSPNRCSSRSSSLLVSNKCSNRSNLCISTNLTSRRFVRIWPFKPSSTHPFKALKPSTPPFTSLTSYWIVNSVNSVESIKSIQSIQSIKSIIRTLSNQSTGSSMKLLQQYSIYSIIALLFTIIISTNEATNEATNKATTKKMIRRRDEP